MRTHLPGVTGGGDERAMVRGSKWWPERVRKWGEVRWQMKTLRLLMMLEADEGEEVFVLLGRWWTLEKHLRNDPRNSDQSRIRFISNSTHQLSTHRPPFPTTIKFPTFHVFSNSHCSHLFSALLLQFLSLSNSCCSQMILLFNSCCSRNCPIPIQKKKVLSKFLWLYTVTHQFLLIPDVPRFLLSNS